jgi:hypothetical protein
VKALHSGAFRGPRLGLRLLALALATSGFAPATRAGQSGPLTPRSQVLIYYANETSEHAASSPNYSTLFAELRKSSNPLVARLAQLVAHDAEVFPTIVRRDIEDLSRAAMHFGFDLATFTNAMAVDNRYRFVGGASGSVETRRFPEPAAASSPILTTSPLSRPDVLRSALLEVSRGYPVDGLDVVLIVNSHGSGDMAMIPRVNADLSSPDRALALIRLLESGGAGNAPAWTALQGTTKLEFWRMLRDVSSARGVRFLLVFREACSSGVAGWTELSLVPPSVEAFAHTARETMKPIELDYGAMFAAGPAVEDWIARLSGGLQHHGIHVSTRRTLWVWPLFITLGSIPTTLFFVPLVGWLAWHGTRKFVVRWRTARQAA